MTTDVRNNGVAVAEIAETPAGFSSRVTEVICTLGAVRIEWAAAFAIHQVPMSCQRGTLVIEERTTVSARNHAMTEVMDKTPGGLLLFWDDDIIPRDRSTMARMIAAMNVHPEIDVLGGVYPTRREVPEPIVVANAYEGAYWGWQDGNIHKVFMVGTGYMMIRMDSFKDTEGPWFDDNHGMSDDFYFGEFCKTHGKGVYVDGGVICDQMDLDGKRYRVEDGVPVIAEIR